MTELTAHDSITQAALGSINLVDVLNIHRQFLHYVDPLSGKNYLDIALEKGLNETAISAIVRKKGGRPELAHTRLKGRLPLFRFMERTVMVAEDVKVALVLLRAYPKAAHEVDSGVTILQMVLEKKEYFIPEFVDLMEQLLKLNTHQAYACSSGLLPLHLALHRKMPVRGIDMLLAANPEAGGVKQAGSHYPLFTAIRNGLSLQVVNSLIENYPKAMCEIDEFEGATPLEWAIYQNSDMAVVRALVQGGEGKSKMPRCVAFAQASLDRMTTRASFSIVRDQEDVEAEFRQTLSIWPRLAKMTLQVKPYHGDCFPVTLEKDLLVEDLKRVIELMEGTRVEFQKLVDSSGHRLREGDSLERCISIPQGPVPFSVIQANKMRDPESYIVRPHEGDVFWNPQNDMYMPTVFLVQRADVLLHCISGQCSAEVVEEVLFARPHFAYDQDEHGALPLHVALQCNPVNERIVHALYEVYPAACRARSGKASHHPYALEMAFKKSLSPDTLSLFIEDRRSEATADKRHWTPLRKSDWSPHGYFCPGNETEFVKKHSPPPLFVAIKTRCSKKILEGLVKSGCPYDRPDPVSGLSVLEMSVTENSDDEVFNYLYGVLTDHDPGVLLKGPSGGTLLHTACLTKSPDYIIAKIISGVSKGKEIDDMADAQREMLRQYDHRGYTPLHCGCETQLPRTSVIELLKRDRELAQLRSGATSEERLTGLLPIQLAVARQPVDGFIFELARAFPESLDALDSRGRSLLQIAAEGDAPSHVIHELLAFKPELLHTVQAFDPNFPNNPVANEIRRLAMPSVAPPKKVRGNSPPRRETDHNRMSNLPPPQQAPAHSSANSGHQQRVQVDNEVAITEEAVEKMPEQKSIADDSSCAMS